MKKQSGSVLLISLVMLLILTVVGIASISGVSMTEKMTNSQRDYDIAFEMAVCIHLGLRGGNLLGFYCRCRETKIPD